MLLVLGEGFEPPNPEGADLQSAVFNHFTTPANQLNLLEPILGFEPRT